MKKALFGIICILFVSTSVNAQAWSHVGSFSLPLNAYSQGIYTVCSDTHGNIYIGGFFSDDSGAVSVYKWDGIFWTELGHGSTALSQSWPVTAIFVDTSGYVYSVAGTNDSVETMYVAKWDGTSWSQVGTGSNALYAQGGIEAITMDKMGNLYAAGGYRDTAGGYFVAKWDGTNWSEVGTGGNALKANGMIDALFIDTLGNIYAGGTFSDGVSVASGNLYVAKWDGTSWSELGTGVCPQHSTLSYPNTSIFSILLDTLGSVYVSGSYFYNDSFTYVAKWDGTSWTELGSPGSIFHANDNINQLCTDRYGNIYAAGDFTDTTTVLTLALTSAQTYTVNPCYVAKWDGSTWSKLGTGSNALNADDWIQSICTDPAGNIYAVGEFADTSVTYSYPDAADSLVTDYGHPQYVAKYSNPLLAGIASLHKTNGVNIFPNPATTSLTISATDKINTVTISNLFGQTLYNNHYNSLQVEINLADLPSDIYFVKINGTEVRKFVKL